MRFKRYLCFVIAIICLILSALSVSAFTIQSSHSCQCADSSGAYSINWNGNHADISRYTSSQVDVGLDLNNNISAACAYHGKIILFCDDTLNHQLYIYVYYFDSDILDSFGIYDAKLYGGTDFGCDDSAVYIENHKNNKEILSYSYDGVLLNRYNFDNDVSAIFSGYSSGAFAVVDHHLYQLSGGKIIPVSDASVDVPVFSADDQVIATAFGEVLVLNDSRVERTFTVDTDHKAASACVVNGILYYPCGSDLYGYDLNSGEKYSYYHNSFVPTLIYQDDNQVFAIDSDFFVSLDTEDFTLLVEPTAENVSEEKGDSNHDSGKSNKSTVSTNSKSSKSSKNTANSGNTAKNGSSNTAKSDSAPQSVVSEISSKVYTVNMKNHYITGITPETTLAQFKSNMNYTGYSVAFYRNNKLIKSGNACTAMKAVFSSNNDSIEFKLSVVGDITGKGNCNSHDLNLLMDHLIGSANLSGVYTVAADVYADGKIDVKDLAVMKRTV